MNVKTTLYLAILLGGLGVFFLWRPRADLVDVSTANVGSFRSSPVARDLIDPKLGPVVKVACRRKGREEWVFEQNTDSNSGGSKEWRMTSPNEMKVTSWAVDRIAREISELQYEISYKADDPGAISPAEAGLDVPKVVVTLADDAGRSATVEIGSPVSRTDTYVRLAGSDTVCVATTSLADLLKPTALEYRDQQLWTFKPQDVTRVEIEDRTKSGEPTSYVFTREATRWMMASPAVAKATSKVEEMTQAMSRLRVIKWHDDRMDRLLAYGLKPAALTIRATVTQDVPAENTEGDDESEESDKTADEPKTKTTVYELHLSDRAPIGEETKSYVRIGDESAVGTIMKTNVDKFKPVMSKWREMHITTENVTSATRIVLTTPAGSATLVKKERVWQWSGDEGLAEEASVQELLKAVGDLTAVAFVDGQPSDLGALGLDQPRAEIQLTIPSLEQPERIAVGGYTDAKTRRLVYVRRNDVASVGKVRASEVELLLREPSAYYDRTITDLVLDRVERIDLAVDNRYGDARRITTFERIDDVWKMTAPVAADVRTDPFTRLVKNLAGLRADAISAQQGEPSQFGLHAPQATVAVTYRPPVQYRLEKPDDSTKEDTDAQAEGTDANESEGPQKLVPVEVQPPSETVELSVAQHDGKYYAMRSDRSTIYEVSALLGRKLFEEYRAGSVLNFDDTAVQSFSVRRGDEAHVFERLDDGWRYQPEPDLPLDEKKVADLLLRIKDLKTERYVDDSSQAEERFGLTASFQEVSLTLKDGSRHVLLIADKRCAMNPSAGFYAMVQGRPGVFLLSPNEIDRFKVVLAELESSG